MSAYADLARSARRPCPMAKCLSAVAHALTTAAVDVTRGLRADLEWSAFHLENAAALVFQQGRLVFFFAYCPLQR